MVVDEEADARSVLKGVSGVAGIKAVSAKKGAESPPETEPGQALVLEQLGVAIVDAPPEQVREMAASDEASPLTIVEPERYVYAMRASRSCTPSTTWRATATRSCTSPSGAVAEAGTALRPRRRRRSPTSPS